MAVHVGSHLGLRIRIRAPRGWLRAGSCWDLVLRRGGVHQLDVMGRRKHPATVRNLTVSKSHIAGYLPFSVDRPSAWAGPDSHFWRWRVASRYGPVLGFAVWRCPAWRGCDRCRSAGCRGDRAAACGWYRWPLPGCYRWPASSPGPAVAEQDQRVPSLASGTGRRARPSLSRRCGGHPGGAAGQGLPGLVFVGLPAPVAHTA